MDVIYKIKSANTEETLAWDSYLPSQATKLIVGTFPTVPSKRDFEFFYPNKNNDFWRLLSALAGNGFELSSKETPEQAVTHRKAILDHLGLGITDIGHKILRRSSSSADSSIFPLEYTDFFQLLKKHPLVAKVFLTSKGLKNNSVEGWLADYFSNNCATFPNFNQKINPRRAIFEFEGREVELITIHSPSRQTRSVTYEAKLEMYRNEIL
jgi:G:T/U-mismatch repair DNA glycosylase